MRFFPYEPIEIPKQKNGLIANDKKSMKEFWQSVERVQSDLSQAIGIYIFSIRAGMGVLPWYIGKAEKQPFCVECFGHHKLTHYNNSIAKRKGTPLLTLIPKLTKTGKFSRPTTVEHNHMATLEKMLIGTCYQRNNELVNIRDTKLHKEMIIPGFINTPQGKQKKSVSEFKKLIGV